ncbi:MAG: NADP-dependent oxidoreductase, partial [Roseateles sp.]
MSQINRQIVLASRPRGEVTPENFRLVEAPLAALTDGQVRVRNHFLSLDPYMRGRMNESKSYAASQPLDEVMIGGTVGAVVESKNANFAVGDKVVGMGGWQEFQTVDATQRGVLQKVDTTHIPLSAYLGAVGMPDKIADHVSLWGSLL